MKHKSEKRLYDRKPFDHPLTFEISVLGEELKNIEQNGVGVDISPKGLGMIAKYALKEGSVLKFSLPMREMEITVPIYAQVLWSKPADDYCRVGLRFLG